MATEIKAAAAAAAVVVEEEEEEAAQELLPSAGRHPQHRTSLQS